MDNGSFQVREYWSGVGDKEQRHVVESAAFFVTRVKSLKLLPRGISRRLCEGWRWVGLEEERQCLCA